MAFAVVRCLLNASKISPSSKILLKSAPKNWYDIKNTRTLTRSLFYMSSGRSTDNLSNAKKGVFSIKCGCCNLHTKGDKELAAFLAEEIENEKKARPDSNLPQLEDFVCDLNGAEVTLTKKLENEVVIIKANVNNSVDADDTVMDPNESKDPQEGEMKSKPEFTIEIKKGKKVLSFLCNYSQHMTDEIPSEEYNDIFQIGEICLYEHDIEDSTYTVSGDIMDGYLYDLLMNYLEERGISNLFAEKLIHFFTSYEHKLYIDLLKDMKTFVEKK